MADPIPEPEEPSDDLGITAEDLNRAIAQGQAGGMLPRIGLEYLEVTRSRMRARIPVEGNTQRYGVLHGGATAALCETLASMGTAVLAGLDKAVMGIELNVNHIRSVREGFVTATGVPLHIGPTTAVWDVRVHDDQARLVAVSRLTLAIREPTPAASPG